MFKVIGSDGGNLGTIPLNKAIELAKQEGLDLNRNIT
jgi:translation initiation factor IF-3